MENKTVYKNNVPQIFDMLLISNLIENELCEYSYNQKKKVLDYIGFLVSDLDVSNLDSSKSLERFYFNAVKAFLEDGHTVYDLDRIIDDGDVFEYCGAA